MTNPLLAYRPHPRVYVKLPTCGAYYSDDVLDTKDHEIGVCAMSAKDEMLLNNPEALMNGRALSQVIENCVPSVKNAIELTSVADYGFTLLTVFQKRHVFLDCVARDYEQKDGFSSANALLDELHFKYLELQQSKQLE